MLHTLSRPSHNSSNNRPTHFQLKFAIFYCRRRHRHRHRYQRLRCRCRLYDTRNIRKAGYTNTSRGIEKSDSNNNDNDSK
ncbi:unnamed protein product [Ceratitis capitata]|uniref:(Mediterranean fruit fly) hypothetical protein n=1 Tax=Ceratitis capitata TaxID=7213 RepID=A0A811U673_CERCA|nr:unnamed protein product [Ceratitis capitata]